MKKNIMKLGFVTVLILLIPLALTIRDGGIEGVGWNWRLGDFIFAFVLIFGSGLAYLFASAKMASNSAYKGAVAVALLGAFLLVWINAAVGIIGDGPINMLYPLMVLIGIVSSFVIRFKPNGMARVLFAMAIAQMLIPVIAFIVNTPDFTPGVLGVFMLNAFFSVLFAGSALLFRQARM